MMTPKWIQSIQGQLGDEVDFITNCVPGIDDELKKECFEVYKKAVVLAGLTNTENAGVYVCRRFEMFHEFLQSEWVERDSNPDDAEFRDMINEYGMTQRVAGKETSARKEEVKTQEKKIMDRIREDSERETSNGE